MKQRVIVGSIISRNDEFLFIRKRKSDGSYAGLNIVGGGLEPGEALEDAMRREIREETGIEVGNLTPISFDADVLPAYKGEPHQLVFLQYSAEYASGTPTAGDDAQEILWVKKAELPNVQLNDSAVKLLQKLGQM